MVCVILCTLANLIFNMITAFSLSDISSTLDAKRGNGRCFRGGFEHAKIRLADGNIVFGTVTDFHTYEHNDNVEVTICGTTYFTHSSNVTLTTT